MKWLMVRDRRGTPNAEAEDYAKEQLWVPRRCSPGGHVVEKKQLK